MKFLRSTLLFAAGAAVALSPLTSHAQSNRALELNREAYEQYVQANYEQAAELYNQLLRDHPTDQIVPVAQVQLGFTQFFLTNFDESLEILEKSQDDPTIPGDLRPAIASFIPQVYSAKAAAMEPDNPLKEETFNTAIERFGAYLENFPQGDEVERVRFGRALAKFQINNLDGAVEDLEANLQQFPTSPGIEDSENLLALTLATQASRNLLEGDDANRAEEFARFERAKSLLRGIIDKGTNLTLVNDARFQLAEILFGMASLAPTEEREQYYTQAMEAYREVAPNEEMIALQEERLATYPERRRRVLLNQPALRALDREIEREQRRLSQLQGKTDMIAASAMKRGEIYFHRGDLNRARVVLRHVTPFLERDEDKKRAQYFLTLSYILQNQAPDAVENYNVFQERHHGDSLGQNLPLAMGNMFLTHPDPSVRDTDRAIEFFDQSLEIYPEGQFAGLTIVTKASALVNRGQLEEAEQTFEEFLAGTPTPDEELVARMGLGDIYIRSQQWDKAIAAYSTVMERFPDSPNSVDAEYWVAISTNQKGDHAAAIPLLKTFIESHPDSQLLPNVLYTLASSYVTSEDMANAMETLTELADRFPDSDPAPVTYFQRAQMLAREQRMEEADEMMRAFIETYPQSDRIFGAFEWLGQGAYRGGNFETAIDQYNLFAQTYPDRPQTAIALLRVSEYGKQWAESLGRYGALNNEERAVWQERMENAAQAAVDMIQNHPDSSELPLGIQNLIAVQEAFVNAEIQSPQEIETFVREMAETAQPDLRSKLLFGLSTYIAKTDPDRALEIMEEAYDPNVVFAPGDLDIYGLALLTQGRVEETSAIFEKLLADYPIPANTAPNAAPPVVQQAQSIGTFGLARVAQEQDETARATELFSQLKEYYPWSPKVLDAELGIAQGEFAAGKLDEAMGRLPAIIRAPNASAEVRAKAMLLGGSVMQKKAEASRDPKDQKNSLEAAIDYFIKIDQFYAGVPRVAAEGLWRGGQLLETQAQGITDDPQFRQRQINQAKRAYQDLVSKYPNSQYVGQARERLQALGVD